jgi:succinate dehydrogenase flavin-adding protein (antitoxin of CptAB toxin-antitoxin module)
MGDAELEELLEVWLELYGHNYTGEETDEIRRILKSNDKQVIFQAVHFYVDGM